MEIAVLGGCGFIGARLVTQLLAAGHQVRIFDKVSSTAHPTLATLGDVRDRAALKEFMAHSDCVINLAAEHRDDVKPVSLYTDVNVRGAENVVFAAEANGVEHILFLSTVAVYGLDQPLASESAAIRPFNHYGQSKAQAEAVYTKWASAKATQRVLTVLRPCVVFGEGNRGNVFKLIEQIRRGRFLMVGDGNNHKSVAYVQNLADFMCLQIHAPTAGIQVFNYADKPDLTTTELVQKIRALLPDTVTRSFHVPYGLALAGGYAFDVLAWLSGRSLAISSARVRKFCAETRVATDALEQIGFQPKFTIEEGLLRMIADMATDESPRQR
ncbi:MAG: NAD(P)-dependent oxidoreductase [Pseudomonadota bacterium]